MGIEKDRLCSSTGCMTKGHLSCTLTENSQWTLQRYSYLNIRLHLITSMLVCYHRSPRVCTVEGWGCCRKPEQGDTDNTGKGRQGCCPVSSPVPCNLDAAIVCGIGEDRTYAGRCPSSMLVCAPNVLLHRVSAHLYSLQFERAAFTPLFVLFSRYPLILYLYLAPQTSCLETYNQSGTAIQQALCFSTLLKNVKHKRKFLHTLMRSRNSHQWTLSGR